MSDSLFAQKKLAAELAVAVSQFVQTELEAAENPGWFYHMFQGPFDEDCYTVWELDGAWAYSGFGGERLTYRAWLNQGQVSEVEPPVFQFMEPDAIRSAVMGRERVEHGLMFRLLEAYLRSMVDYKWQGASLETGRAYFVPAPIFEPQIEALMDCGYLQRAGSSVQWTDRIAPVMKAAGFWDETLAPPACPPLNVRSDVLAEVEALMASGDRIAAVNAIRNEAKTGVKEAVRYLEELERRNDPS